MRTLSWMLQELGQPTVYLVDWTCRLATSPRNYLPDKFTGAATMRGARRALAAMFGHAYASGRTADDLARWMEEAAVPGKTVDRQPVLRFVRDIIDAAFPAARQLRGRSAKLLHAIVQVIRLAQRNVDRVLLEGETGVGKELLAALFAEVAGAPTDRFQRINCAALPETLLETLMFGIAAKVASGVDRHPGVVKDADVLFLDEVEALPPTFQVKLLRFLDCGLYRPVGSLKELESKVKIIAATNEPLKQLVEQRRFRSDVYYRLTRGGRVHIPPLRERSADIGEIAQHLANQRGAALDDGSIAKLKQLRWLGNVRQLDSVIEAAASESVDGLLMLEDFLANADIGPALMTIGDDFTRYLLGDLRKQPEGEPGPRLERCAPPPLRHVVAWTAPAIASWLTLLNPYRVRSARYAKDIALANKMPAASWVLALGRAAGLYTDDPEHGTPEPGWLRFAREEFSTTRVVDNWVSARAALALTPPDSPLWPAFRQSCDDLRLESIRQVSRDLRELRTFVENIHPADDDEAASKRLHILRTEAAIAAIEVVDRILARLLPEVLVQPLQEADLWTRLRNLVTTLVGPPVADQSPASTPLATARGPLHTPRNEAAFRQRYATLKGQGLSEPAARAELARESGKSLGSIHRALRKLDLVKKRRSRRSTRRRHVS